MLYDSQRCGKIPVGPARCGAGICQRMQVCCCFFQKTVFCIPLTPATTCLMSLSSSKQSAIPAQKYNVSCCADGNAGQGQVRPMKQVRYCFPMHRGKARVYFRADAGRLLPSGPPQARGGLLPLRRTLMAQQGKGWRNPLLRLRKRRPDCHAGGGKADGQ